MTIDSSGNLLVGKTVTTFGTDGHVLWEDGLVDFSRTATSTTMRVNKNTHDGDLISFSKDGSTVGSIGTAAAGTTNEFGIVSATGQLVLGTTTNNNHVQYDNTALYPVPDNTINLGYSTLRWKDLYLSGGVYLGGTGSANKLDDYEEGTFTPDLEGDVTAGSQTGTRLGHYTKVGNVVTCVIRFLGYELSGYSGRILIKNLPFTSVSTTVGGGSLLYIEGASFTTTSGTNETNIVASVGSNVTHAVLQPHHVSTSYDKFVTGITFGSIDMYANIMITYFAA
jgi:hypothetical protein